MQNARLDEAQAGIKIARRNISNLRNTDITTLTAESEEELKSLLMKVKEESGNVGLKVNIQKTKISIWSHYFMANRWGNNGNSDRLYFGGSKITADGDCNHETKRRLLLGRNVMINLDSILKSRDLTSLVAQTVKKRLSTMQVDLGSIPGSGSSLEKEKATHSSTLA